MKSSIAATFPGAAGSTSTVTGSRRLDLVLFGIGLLVVVVGSRELVVYHAVTVVDVRLFRIDPDGREEPLPTPPALRWRGGIVPPGAALKRVRAAIRAHLHGTAALADTPAGTRYAWVVDYGSNTTTLAERRVFVVRPRRRGG